MKRDSVLNRPLKMLRRSISYVEQRKYFPVTRKGAYSTACGHLFHAHVASHSMTCGHPREVICEAVSS